MCILKYDKEKKPKKANNSLEEKTDQRKRALEVIELIAVAVICIIMYFHERETVLPEDTEPLLRLGDKVLFGTYLDEPIEWRVVQLEENGAAVLLAEYILTMKAFSAPDSGCFNYDDDGNSYWSVSETEADRDLALQAYVRGSSSWAQSDLRIWLNSDKENVVYDGIGPVAGAMCNIKNGYASEAGFLAGFTVQEREAIIPTVHSTRGNACDSGPVQSTDLVYLLSEEELSWLMEADVSLRTKPTALAAEQDQTKWYKMFSLDYGIDEYYWWLRDPVPEKSSNCYYVSNGYSGKLLSEMEAGAEGVGIRPAVCVDTKKFALPCVEASEGLDERQE